MTFKKSNFFLSILLMILATNCSIDEEGALGFFFISGFDPIHAVPGETVQISGNGFGLTKEGLGISLHGTALEISSISDSLVSFRIPDSIATNKYVLSLTRDHYETISREYDIKNYPAPRIYKVSPFGSSAGDTITIEGKYFPTSKNLINCFFLNTESIATPVGFNGFINLNDSMIVVQIPDEVQITEDINHQRNYIYLVFGPYENEADLFSISVPFR